VEEVYNKIAEIAKGKEKGAICTIIATKGSTPLKSGAKMVVMENKKIFGTIGGGHLEDKVINDALEVIKNNTPQLYKHDLFTQHGMCCGGNLDIFIEPIMKKKNLYIFGAGHVGKSIAKHCSDLDFEIFVIDGRKDIFIDWNQNNANQMPVDHNELLLKLNLDEQSYIVISTHDHTIDREVLAHCINKNYAYIGMIGSKRKIEQTKQMFLSSKVATEKELAKVDMPIGLEINAKTHDEIAISIVAKLVKEKNTAK
jgi:xanthine dehydrogenase accessory factor